MAVGIVTAILPTILQYTVGPLISHFSFAFYYKRKVEKLNDQVEKLSGARENLLHSVDDARRGGEEIQKNVEKWLTDAEKAIEEARELIKGKEQVDQKCFILLCPNLKSRYQLGKEAAEKALALEGLEKEGKFDRVQISHRATLQQLLVSSVNGFEGMPSRLSILKEVINALSEHDVNKVGVYGMGGTGKTTLANEVHKQVRERKLFDVVVMVTVSETPDLKRIQGEIADMLGLKFDEETEVGRASRLWRRLIKEEKVLIILDNLWEKLELEKVGIPLVEDHKGCKLLLTSRRRDVLSNQMGTQKDFRLEVLSEEESWNLFERTVGGIKNPKLQSIAIEVAERCAGLPLLLVTVASALKNQELEVWKDGLQRLSSYDDEEIQAKVYSALELSYNHLVGEEVKSFFLLCGLFGYSNIDIHDLLMYGMGLGLFKHVNTMEGARNRAHKLIGVLKASCLLLESQRNRWVKIHDVVRDVAASIASKSQRMFMLRGEMVEWPNKDVLRNCVRISSIDFDIGELPVQLECPELEFLCLYPKDLSLKIPDSFFVGLEKLKILDLTKMSFSALPSSLGSLSNLHTLCLCDCMLHDVAIIGELKQIEILSFVHSDIAKLPKEISQLTRLKLLDLSHCTKLEVIPANFFSKLSLLEELRIGNSFAQWDGKSSDNESNASLSELERLSRLTNLEIHVLDAKKLPKGLFCKRLERYKIFIGDDWDWDDDYDTLKTLKLKLNISIHGLHGVKTLLKEAENLSLDELKGIKNILYDLDLEGFLHLKYLHIQNDPEIQYLIDSERWVPCKAFPILESLFLHNLMSLQKICHGPLAAESFSKLRILIVRNCSRLKKIFSLSMIRGLLQLREMEVIDCNGMEEIFSDDNEDGNSKSEAAEFIQLCSLKLKLPQLISLCSNVKVTSVSQTSQKQSTSDVKFNEIVSEGELDTPLPLFNEMVILPNLEEVILSSMKVEKIWHSQHAHQFPCFQKLKSLIVQDCGNLTYLFTSSMVNSLVQLRRLEICDCNSMKEIIVAERFGGEIKSNILLPNLEFLKLSGLSKLIRFCRGNLIECPSLKELWIRGCSQLNKFLSSPANEDAASTSNPRHMDAILFDEKVAFPNLEKLRIINMDFLKMIWHNQLHENSFCKLRYLTVEKCKRLLKIFPSNVLVRFHNLEKLDIDGCDSLKEAFDLQGVINAKVSDNEIVTRLKTMYLWNLPNLEHIWSTNPHGVLSFQNLQIVDIWECPRLKSLFPASVAKCLPQLESIRVSCCGVEEIVAAKEEGEESSAPRFAFPKVNSVVLWNLPKLDKFYPGMHSTVWPALKELRVYTCDRMKIFAFDSKSIQDTGYGDQPETLTQQPLFSFQEVVPNLEQLPLSSEDAKIIREGDFPAYFFDKIKAVELISFHEEPSFFPLDVLHRFPRMESLVVVSCKFKELFPCEGQIFGSLGTDNLKGPPHIRHLRLDLLPDLKQICYQDPQLDPVLSRLETLEVRGCHSLISIAQSSASFQSLTTLDVQFCDGLLYLMAFSTAKSLVQLKNMKIRECDKATEIVVASHKGEDEAENEVVFRSLASLELHHLPRLTSFCSANRKFKFPTLTELIVSQCPKMETFTGGVLSTPKLETVKLSGEDDNGKGCWHTNLNVTIQQLFRERTAHLSKRRKYRPKPPHSQLGRTSSF